MKEFISWNVVDECVLDIAEHLIRTEIKFDGVYGIPRGGAVLAVMLSHKLDIPFIMDVKEGPYHAVRDDYIIIDDIVDTGETLKKYKEQPECRNSYFVTIHEHEHSSVKPDYSVLYKEDKWIVYPWEIEESEEIQDYFKQEKLDV